MGYTKNSKLIIVSFSLITIILTLAPAEGTYVDDGSIVILRSQYVDSGAPDVNGYLLESLWGSAGLYSLKVLGGGFDGVNIQFRFANDDSNLYFGFTISNFEYDNVALGIYFDSDADGFLSTPEDGKLIKFKSGSASTTGQDLHWTGDKWQEDGNSQNSGFLTNSINLIGSKEVTVEMLIPLLSTDLAYDGLQISTTSNTYIGLAFSITNDFNNGTVNTFEFPTNPANVSEFVDLRLAGPEDKDLPTYIPPAPVTTSVTPPPVDQVTETVTNFFADSDDDAAALPSTTIPLILMTLSLLVINKRRRKA